MSLSWMVRHSRFREREARASTATTQAGFTFSHTARPTPPLSLNTVRVLDEEGERALGKPRGSYVTLTLEGLASREEGIFQPTATTQAGFTFSHTARTTSPLSSPVVPITSAAREATGRRAPKCSGIWRTRCRVTSTF